MGIEKLGVKFIQNTGFKKTIELMNSKNFARFITSNRALSELPYNDKLLMSIKLAENNNNFVPVFTNLRSGTTASLNNGHRFQTQTVQLLEEITDKSSNIFRRFFGEGRARIIGIQGLRNPHGFPLAECLPNSPMTVSQQELLAKFAKIAKFDGNTPKYMKLPKSNMLAIDECDNGYLFYLTDEAKTVKPASKYFYAAFAQNGFKFKFDPKVISQEEVSKIFDRYVNAYIELTQKVQNLNIKV